MGNTTTIMGALEIDHDRGVIYFHALDVYRFDAGITVLRICQLPKPIPKPERGSSLLDITHMYGASWEGKKS
jgi:hypothetical protein